MSTAPATIQDVAELAEVNFSTVSRAFSGRGTVAETTRQRILDAAESIGYRPSMAARSTRMGRSGIIGMLSSCDPSLSVVAPAFLAGLSEALHARGLCLLSDILDGAEPRGKPASHPPRILREHGVDGLLINYAFKMAPASRRLLETSKLPSVWINQDRPFNCVRPNDHGAAVLGTQSLLSGGHLRLCYVDEAPRPNPVHYSHTARREGYERAMAEAGLEPRVFTPDPMPPSGAYPLRLNFMLDQYCRLLRGAGRPGAVLCSGGGRVMLAAACRVGLRVPDDLAVLTFDNDPGADTRVAVDRLLVPYRAMGLAAAYELNALIGGSDRQRPAVVLPFEFHRVGTTG